MEAIETFLHEHFATAAEAEASVAISNGLGSAPTDTEPEVLEEPFARVNSVATGGPAEIAGLQSGDEIRRFGYVNRANHDGLKRVAECVQGNEGVRNLRVRHDCGNFLTCKQANIHIRVSRLTGIAVREELRLTLTPRRDWGGRGMLGCHILPI